MLDAESVKARTDLLALVGRDVPGLKKIAGTRGGEYAGPCPVCNSGHRVHVQPSTGLFMARCCHEKWGDAIEYLRWTRGLDFKEAVAALGGGALPSRENLPGPKPQPSPPPEPVAPPVWEEAGLRAVADCQAVLWSEKGARAREWLHKRGLTDETLREWRIGYNPQPKGSEAKGCSLHALFVWYGIVIPGLAVDGRLHYVKIRRPAGEPKYLAVKGSKPAMLGRLTGKRTLLLTEGEFDAMLAWQEAGDLVDVATLGSATADPMPWISYLLGYERLLIAYDIDEAGEKGAGKWDWTARARRIRLPLDVEGGEGKDLTDLVRAGGSVRAWTESALLAEDLEVAEPRGLAVVAARDALDAEPDLPQCRDCDRRATCYDQKRILAAPKAEAGAGGSLDELLQRFDEAFGFSGEEVGE